MDELTEFVEQGEKKGQWEPKLAPVNWGDIPDNLYEQSEFRDMLQKCLTEVPDSLRMVFTLREIDGLSSEKVCKELEISSSNFWVMMHRARNLLRRCLEINWFSLKK